MSRQPRDRSSWIAPSIVFSLVGFVVGVLAGTIETSGDCEPRPAPAVVTTAGGAA